MNKKIIFILAATFMLGTTTFAQKAKCSFFGGKSETRNTKRIFITGFQIEQMVQQYASARSGGDLSHGTSNTHLTAQLGEIDPARYQAAITEVYNQIQERLKSMGYEIISDDEAKPLISKKTEMNEETAEAKGKFMSGEKSVKVYPKDKLLSFTNGIAGNYYGRISKDLNGGIVLNFNFIVNFAGFKTSGGSFANKSSVELSPAMYITGNMLANVTKGAGMSILNGYNSTEDWLGPKGAYKASATDLKGMGYTSGIYLMDVDQDKYLAILKTNLLAAANACVDAWQEELK